MAVVNGVIDGALLFPAAGSSGARLRFGSAYRWGQCRSEVQRRYGWWPEVTSAGDGYRPLETQERIFFQRYSLSDSGWRGAGHIKWYQGKQWFIRTNPVTGRPYAVAATPGSSNHGLGKAVDVSGLSSMVLVRWAQFADVAPEFGFSNAEGQPIGEAWHWVDTLDPDVALGSSAPPPTTETPIEPEDDFMSHLSYEEQRRVLAHLDTLGSWLPSIKTNTDLIPAVGVQATEGNARTNIALVSLQNITNAVVALLGRPLADVDENALADALRPLLATNLTEADVIAAVKSVFADAGKR